MFMLTQITAIICLTVIAVFALMKGIDSVLLSTISAIIGGIAGYYLKNRGEEK